MLALKYRTHPLQNSVHQQDSSCQDGPSSEDCRTVGDSVIVQPTSGWATKSGCFQHSEIWQ